ncbi:MULTISPECIES: carbon-nitrogen hydrolase family protein [Rhodococcus]|uniref:Carbon-nitrogen hydrolase family protein n=1 Tax=Rhodococcus erythropolis TaxID=1833 RepID=A0AAX3ZXN6_RHOER|nr:MULTISPECIES: carbon-nitrogen hydrolase family protein [Rhodococcus]MDJ0011006.1 carbon-nitrogen hydrolase family protein [Rhodococcus erythropolis]OXM20764.1 hypothetical protein CBI33_17460 [Rhodococcus erythropolis]WMN01813.1 carbon-nitrogen hydrolase family protein [Rhodococcus erythropolis]
MTTGGSLAIRLAQVSSVRDVSTNAELCQSLVDHAVQEGIDLLVLPESASSRTDAVDESPQDERLDGFFVRKLAESTRGTELTVIVGVTETADTGRPFNTIVALRDGEIISTYRKIHLYDAFAFRESDSVTAGDGTLSTFVVKGFSIGMLTCYDIRFPEVARLLADKGVDVLVLPTSWVSGPLKEEHWETLCKARALENTCFLAAAGQTGGNRIGRSMIVGPDGVVRAMAGIEEGTVSVSLSMALLHSARHVMPVLKQRRFFVDPRATDVVSASDCQYSRS